MIIIYDEGCSQPNEWLLWISNGTLVIPDSTTPTCIPNAYGTGGISHPYHDTSAKNVCIKSQYRTTHEDI